MPRRKHESRSTDGDVQVSAKGRTCADSPGDNRTVSGSEPDDSQPHQNDQGDWVCGHGTAMDVHCCNCHSGFLFDAESCTCLGGSYVPLSFECPESSSIQGARYDPETRQLFIVFRKWHVQSSLAEAHVIYCYGNIDPHLWEEFVQAMSKGKFVSARIRPMYNGTKV